MAFISPAFTSAHAFTIVRAGFVNSAAPADIFSIKAAPTGPKIRFPEDFKEGHRRLGRLLVGESSLFFELAHDKSGGSRANCPV